MAGAGGAASGNKVYIGGVEIDHEDLKKKAADHFRNKVLVVDDTDKQVWELTTNVPKVSQEVAYLCAFLNFIIPGLGSLVAACSN